MEVTLETLRQYASLEREIKAIDAEIRSLYYPLSSAPMMSDGGHSTTPGNPTQRAAFRVMDQKEKLKQKQEEYLNITNAVRDWTDNLDDHDVASIVRFHYISGYTWAETCKEMYGYSDKDTCRQIIRRFFQKEHTA